MTLSSNIVGNKERHIQRKRYSFDDFVESVDFVLCGWLLVAGSLKLYTVIRDLVKHGLIIVASRYSGAPIPGVGEVIN